MKSFENRYNKQHFLTILLVGMIERNCYSGIEDYVNHLSRALNAEGEVVPELKRKSRRKRRAFNLPRSPSEETSSK